MLVQQLKGRLFPSQKSCFLLLFSYADSIAPFNIKVKFLAYNYKRPWLLGLPTSTRPICNIVSVDFFKRDHHFPFWRYFSSAIDNRMIHRRWLRQPPGGSCRGSCRV